MNEQTITILQIILTYESVWATSAGSGMVFVPTWAIIYQDQKASGIGFDCYALFNAMDGSLIDASFQ